MRTFTSVPGVFAAGDVADVWGEALTDPHGSPGSVTLDQHPLDDVQHIVRTYDTAVRLLLQRTQKGKVTRLEQIFDDEPDLIRTARGIQYCRAIRVGLGKVSGPRPSRAQTDYETSKQEQRRPSHPMLH